MTNHSAVAADMHAWNEAAQEAEQEITIKVASLFASIAEESPTVSDDSDSDNSSSDTAYYPIPDDVSIRKLRGTAMQAPGTTFTAVPPHTGVANQETFNKAFKKKMQFLSRPIFSDFWPPEIPPPAREVQIEQLFIKLLKETCNF